MKAFVTDGNQRSALAITRSLGRRGVCVLVGEAQPFSLASSSRYCVRDVTYPSPTRHKESFQQFVLDVVRRERVDLVVPVTDVTTQAVAERQADVERHSAVAVPPLHAFNLVTDKSSLLEHAARCGLRIPRTALVDGLGGLNAVIDGIGYPAVVKPVRSAIPAEMGYARASVHYASDEADLRRLYESCDYLTSRPSLIQERIAGPGFGVFVLFDRGRLLTAFAHRRLREKPPSGGVSVLRESVPLDSRLTDGAMRLLGPLDWHGVAMLEFKQDRASGELFLIEVNGRFWGSLQLAIDAGVDFPYLSSQLALGQRPDVPSTYKVGVQSRWLLGDVDHLLLRLFKSCRALHLPEPAPSRMRTLLDFLTCRGADLRYEVESMDDPRPFVTELRQYVRGLWTAAGERVRGPAASDGRLRRERIAQRSMSA